MGVKFIALRAASLAAKVSFRSTQIQLALQVAIKLKQHKTHLVTGGNFMGVHRVWVI
jgi:hypothetical protein